MTIKEISILCVIGVATITFLWFIPVGTRSALSDIKGGDQRVIALSRPHYIIPREYVNLGGMNPVNFWTYAADPDFSSGKISSHEFVEIDGEIKIAAVQGFNINRMYSNPEYREDVMAIRVGPRIFDYPTPGFEYTAGYGSLAEFHYLGQDGLNLYYYHPLANSRYDPLGNYIEGIVRITLPHESGKVIIVKSTEIEKWASVVTLLRLIDLSPEAFSSLCKSKPLETHRFAQALFGRNCP